MSGRRLVAAAFAVVVVGVVAAVGIAPAARWLSIRRSADPRVAAVAATCFTNDSHVVTGVTERPWGWSVRYAPWRVAYLGAVDNTAGDAGRVFVLREGGALVPWFSGSGPPTDPVTGVELTAPDAADPWEADLALAVAQGREPYVALRCSTRG